MADVVRNVGILELVLCNLPDVLEAISLERKQLDLDNLSCMTIPGLTLRTTGHRSKIKRTTAKS
eukprot:scaffold578133_cov32-Prasinocladus_malaysianus.AAC.1